MLTITPIPFHTPLMQIIRSRHAARQSDYHCFFAYTIIMFNVAVLDTLMYRGVPRIWEGGGKNFFSDLGICMLLGGSGACYPRNFLKRCNLVRLRCILIRFCLYFFKKITIFYIENKYFKYTLAMGYFS